MAKRFRFNLEAVLRYRQIQEDEAKREYLDLKRMMEQERVRREEMSAQRGDIQDEIVQAFSERAPMQAITAAYHMIGKIESAMAESMRREKDLELKAEAKRQAMIKSSQRKKAMEILKDRRREEFVREQDLIEQNFLDDMSIQAQSRRRREAAANLEWEEMEMARRAMMTPEGEGAGGED